MWVLPTYGRPDRCREALASIIAVGCDTPGIVVVDGGDPYPPMLPAPLGWRIERRAENVGLLGVLNRFFAEHPDLPWYGLLTDDAIVRTEGWDRRLVEAAGRFGIASCNDGWQPGRRIAGAVVFGGDLLRGWGWWGAPGLWHTYADDVWERIAGELGNWTYLDDVLVEHRHPFNGKAEPDPTHAHSYSHFTSDRQRFAELLEDEIPKAVARTLDAMGDEAPPRLSMERAKSRSVLICTPVGRQPVSEYVVSLANTQRLLGRLGIRHECRFVVGRSNLAMARNQLAAEFFASDFTDLLFIDDDMGWHPDAVVRLLASEHEVIGGVGRKKCDLPNSDGSVWCVKWLGDRMRQDPVGAVEVQGVGTGFLKIARSVFATMIERRPDLSREGELVRGVPTYHRFFYWGDDGTRELSEDYQFCADWRALGGEIWIDPKIALTHVGSKAYAGSVAEILMPLTE